jgi:hypothetical protein
MQITVNSFSVESLFDDNLMPREVTTIPLTRTQINMDTTSLLLKFDLVMSVVDAPDLVGAFSTL